MTIPRWFPTLAGALLFSICSIKQSTSTYDLRFTLESYSTLNGSCTFQSCANGCPIFCDYNFRYCERLAGSPISFFPGGDDCQGIGILRDMTNFAVQQDLRFSITFSGNVWTQEGVQVLMEALDRQPAQFIDRIVINITDFPVGSVIANQSYSGIFGTTEITASFELTCTEGFQGPGCEISCDIGRCDVCQSGFTGQFCATIDHCAEVDCGQNKHCMNEATNFTCLCDLGFTGPNCLTNVSDPCTEISCNDGQCMSIGNSFKCVCDFGFTGTFCSIIDYCAGVNCTQNFTCVNKADNYTCICDPDGLECNNGELCIRNQCETHLPTVTDNDSTAGRTLTIVILAAFASVVLILLLIAFIACFIVYARIKQKKKLQNANGLQPGANSTQALQTSVEISPEYDYPLNVSTCVSTAPLNDSNAFNFEMCPAYATINGQVSFKSNPAYATVFTASALDTESENYYY